MREVRMTFGEHLEELRKRIINCLLYLVVGVSISMIWGEDLLKWVLVPHYQAVSTENRSRLVRHMVKTLERIGSLASAKPVELKPGEKLLLPTPPGPDDWAALFAREAALPQIARRIEEPFSRYKAVLSQSLSTLPEVDRGRIAEGCGTLGSEVSRVLAEEFAPGLGPVQSSDIPERFRKLLLHLQEIETTAGPNQVESLIGWGGDLRKAIAPLEEFVLFLEGRKAQVMSTPISLLELHKRALESKLPEVLGEQLKSLEKDALDVAEERTPPIMVTSYLESFMAYLKVAFIFGIFLTLPFLLYEMWRFIGAGLHANEQKYVVTLLPFSLALFLAGVLFGYFAMIPVGLKFLAGWGIEDVNLSFTLENYIGLFLTLTLILGLVFQTPLIMIFLTKIGVVDVATYRRVRKFAIFGGVCLAVVLTPPDPFSWSLMAAPMLVLYEVGILACQLMERKKKPSKDNVEEAAGRAGAAGSTSIAKSE